MANTLTPSPGVVALLQDPTGGDLPTPKPLVRIMPAVVFDSDFLLEGYMLQAKATIEDGSGDRMDVYLNRRLRIIPFYIGAQDAELPDEPAIVKLNQISRLSSGPVRCARGPACS